MFVNMPRPPRAPRGALNRDRIIETALELIDSEGLDALSARQLAARLGCKAMSLYNHIASMEDLLDGVVDHLLGSAIRAAPPEGGIATAASGYLALAARHPSAFILVATRVWRGPNAQEAAMRFMSYFQEMGCSQLEALRRARVLGAYLNGSGLALGAWKRSEETTGQLSEGKAVRNDLESGLGDLLTLLSVPASAQQ
jgi:AcrR family transcriptional regulator